MTISLERPVVPADDVQDMVEPYDEPHTVVTVQVRVSRDQLAAAVEDAAMSYGIQDPDALSVERVRSLAALSFACMGALELELAALAMARAAGPDADDVSVQPYIHAVYRAVDRAFPKSAE